MDGHEKPGVHPLVQLAKDIARRLVGIAGGAVFLYGILLMTPMGGALIPLGIIVALVGGAIMAATATSFETKPEDKKGNESDKKE